MTIDYKSIKTEGLSDQIAESIRESIFTGKLKVDDRLPTEEELAVRFGVSRPTIREALKRLAAQNLVRSRRGPTGGTFVNRPSQDQVRSTLANTAALLVTMGEFTLSNIAEARHELEAVCARLAVENRQQIHLDAMQAELDLQRDDSISDREFCDSDVKFHRALVDATQNPVLQFVMSAVIEALQPIENMVIFRVRERETIIRQHERIYSAIRDQNRQRAAAAISQQMKYLAGKFEEAQASWQLDQVK